MLRNLLIILLTLFQDKCVRTGTLVGILIGIWNPEILQLEQGKSVIILGFVGWASVLFLVITGTGTRNLPKIGNSKYSREASNPS